MTSNAPTAHPAGHVLYICVPFLPNMQLSTNARRRLNHWAIHKLTSLEQERWYNATYPTINNDWEYVGCPLRRATIGFTLTFPAKAKQPDYDNCWSALKPCIDVLCAPQSKIDSAWRLGVIQDDSPKCLVAAPSLRYQRGEKAQTEIRIEAFE